MAKLVKESVIRHEAEDDQGEVYTVLEIQRWVSAGTAENPHRIIKGIRRFELPDGSALNKIDAETFKIVGTNQIIRKVG